MRRLLTRSGSGASLDAIKVVAAACMTLDHFNTIVLHGKSPALWHLGRLAFPLFCFSVACNLARGADPWRYTRSLLIWAAAVQVVYQAAFSYGTGNVLMTLGIGVAVAASVTGQPVFRQHLLFAAGTTAIALFPTLARTGSDFGLAGMLIPAAMLLVLKGERTHWPWLFLLLVLLNAHVPRDPATWLLGAAVDACMATLGTGAVILLAGANFGSSGRFLPRHALHAFYPGHLLGLLAIAAILGGR